VINTKTCLMVVLQSGEEVKQKSAEDVESSSSDDEHDGRDESQYRITVPLDVMHTPPPPLFTTPPLPAAVPPTHPTLPLSHPSLFLSHPSVAPSLTAGAVCTPQLAVHQVVRPLRTAASGAVDLMLPVNLSVEHRPSFSLELCPHHHQQQQQLLLPLSVPPPVLRPPRCRDYDGEHVCL